MQITKTPLFALVGVTVLLAGTTLPASAEVITFSEAPISFGTGFNGQANPFFLSSSGEYRVEAFWLNTSGHFHIGNTGGPGGLAEMNHDNSGGNAASAQGIRITRVDGGLFDVLSADLFGQSAVGNFSNFTTGAGTFTLYNGTGTFTNPGSLLFGNSFVGVSSIVFADPGIAGGNSSNNVLDNINLAATAVPEPASMLAWGLIVGIGAVGYRLRKHREPAAVG